jgi:hypothetical protein
MEGKVEHGGDRQQPDKSRTCDDEWDVITATFDGGVLWKRYGEGKIVITRKGETPQEALARYESGAT